MKTAALIDGDLEPPLDGFIETQAPSRKPPERPPFPAISKQAYAKAKFEWIDQINLDSGLTDFQSRVGTCLASIHNMKNGYAYVTHTTLAERLRAKGPRGIKKAIDALEERGHLQVEYSRGAGKANRYFLILKRKLKTDQTPSDSGPKRYTGHAPF
jgi:hypothetical protein